MDLTIEAGELTALAGRCAGLPGRMGEELATAGRASGLLLQGLAQSEIRVDSGLARSMTRLQSVEVAPAGVTVTVASTARSVTGFPYPWVIEEGRGPVVPVRRRFLRFEAGGGVVFAKRVRGVAARPFMRPALVTGRPAIVALVRGAVTRALDSVAGR
jgi:hypothetical protein